MSRARVLARACVIAWVALCILGGALLLARHLLTLPTPAMADPALQMALAATRSPAQRGRWRVLHVLSEDCGCSQRVLAHLRGTVRPPGVVERVVLVHQAGLAAATRVEMAALGFELDVVTPDELVRRYRLEAAPLLVVVDPVDRVRYLGGYTPRKQAADVRDLALIAAVRRGDHPAPLPVFGCAVSRALRAQLDPLGLEP